MLIAIQTSLQERVLKEQTVVEESGTRRLKTKEDGAMGSQILQNPSDPDATYREKEGKQSHPFCGGNTR